MARSLVAAFAIVALLAANGGWGPAAATPSDPGLRAAVSGTDYVVVPLANTSADNVAKLVRRVYARVQCVVDRRGNQLILRGSPGDMDGASRLIKALDAKADPKRTPNPDAYADTVRVFSIDDPASGPGVAAALTAFVQGLAPQPAASASPGTNVNVVIDRGAAPYAAASVPQPAVVLAPSQTKIIVRSDARTLDIIADSVLPALVAPPAEKSTPAQQFFAYEVKYPVPNPVPSGQTFAATSTISDLANSVQTIINQTGPADVRVTADPTYPRVIVAGSSRGVQNALRLLRSLDKRPALVGIEAEFYEVDINEARNVGFQLPTGSIQTTIGEYSPPTVGPNGTLIPPTPPPVLSPQRLTHSPLSIAAQLNLLSQRGIAHLVARPHVSTVNGRLTILSVTNTIPFPVTNPGNSAAVPTVANYTTGTRLEIVPMINGDGSITSFIHPVYTTLTGFTAQAAPLTSMREAFTTFRLISGEAAYISGLEEVNDSTTRQKVPGIGDIPLVGKLFRNRIDQRVTTQLYIVLRASVVDPGDLQLAPLEIDPNNPPQPKPLPRQSPLPRPPSVPPLPSPEPWTPKT